MGKPYSPLQLTFNWLIEVGTIIVFWVVYKLHGLMSAILWSLLATVVAVGLAVFFQRRCPWFPLVMCFVVVVFCGYSLLTQDPQAFVIQHTLYYGLGGVTLAIGWIRGTALLKPLFENLFALTDNGWLILTRRWATLFLLLAVGNEWVWRTMTESSWVVYKMAMTLTVTLFGLWQLRLARRERLPEASLWGLKIR